MARSESAELGPPPPKSVTFLGARVHLLTMDQAVCFAMQAMRQGRRLHQVSLNVAKLVTLRRNAELAADVHNADLVCADGMGIVAGARLFGLPVRERVAGVDLMERLLERCAAEGLRPYFLGATPGVLQQAVARLADRHPALLLAGYRDGYYGTAEEDTVVDGIRSARPDCLFVGMPTPRKERFLARNQARLDVPFIMGVGGGIDILAGKTRRAPLWCQRTGCEWLYRIAQEPGRMWRRYLTTNALYAGILAKAALQQACGRTDPHALCVFDAPPSR